MIGVEIISTHAAVIRVRKWNRKYKC